MKWLFPSPLLSLFLLIMWLLLNESVEVAHILLGSLLAIAAPILTRQLRPFEVTVRKPWVIIKLIFWSLIEIVRSCFNVSSIILLKGDDKLNSQFIRIPLDLRDPTGLALLSCLINSTPGTVWIEVLPETHELSLHVFDLHDENWWIETIKTKYEKPIMEIFEKKGE